MFSGRSHFVSGNKLLCSISNNTFREKKILKEKTNLQTFDKVKFRFELTCTNELLIKVTFFKHFILYDIDLKLNCDNNFMIGLCTYVQCKIIFNFLTIAYF